VHRLLHVVVRLAVHQLGREPLLRRCRPLVRCCLPPGQIAQTRLMAGHVIQPCWCRLWVSIDRVRLSLGYEHYDAHLRSLKPSLAGCVGVGRRADRSRTRPRGVSVVPPRLGTSRLWMR
jgi:hypothetical protein